MSNDRKQLLGWIGVIITLLGVLVVISGEGHTALADINHLKQKVRVIDSINDRLARIETKLDLLLEQQEHGD